MAENKISYLTIGEKLSHLYHGDFLSVYLILLRT